MIECVGTGLVYRNPAPHLRAVNAWHPSIVALPGGELLASFDLGQGAESLDYATWLSRSADGAATWSAPRRIFREALARPTTHSVRLSRAPDGTLVAAGGRFYRDDPDLGLVNRANLGYTEMDLILLRSTDGGRTWLGPHAVKPPLAGPAFETCHALVYLDDGRWLWPLSTWRGWDGAEPNGMKAVALVSRDRGATWPEHLAVMDQYGRGVLCWEQSLRELPGGRLLAVAWAFNEAAGRAEPTPWTISEDGRAFSPPRPTGLRGETAKIHVLADGRILCLYRRVDQPGLWAALARLDGDRWTTLEQQPLWQGAASGMAGQRAAAEELSGLKFGFPSMAGLPDGDVMAVFWCSEDCINVIRWCRLRVR